MKATQRTVCLDLAEPLRISRSTMAARDAVWLTVEHAGLRGHGEAVTSVYYGLDADTLGRLLAAVAMDLLRFRDPESALDALRAGELAGEDIPPAVTAAVEAALLDLAGKRAGSPVHRLPGAATARVAATARTIGITSPVRAAADAVLPRFAELGVEAVEQPLAPGDPEALAARSPLPVIADEDAVSLQDARRLAGRVDGVNVKLAKCGGVHAALRIAEAIEGSGTALMLGCLTAGSLGLAPAVHLVDRARWADLDRHLLLAHDPWAGIGGTDGFVRASDLPGLGVRRSPGEEAA
ncbi:dipeptide epimerase [Streptomyces sp. NBC_01525]|uniref:enolase C-terminal domain-like protein n=1 Tax=Streptomyces sp. NBC_01525 TaxID=2903893 RepID=UPI00386FB1CC